MSTFKTVSGRAGFSITFNNGWTISVQWHEGAYTSRPDRMSARFEKPEYGTEISSPDAEIAIWNKGGDWYDFGTDQVKGYCTADEVAEWIEKVKSFN